MTNKRFTLRIAESIFEEVKSLAETNKRSVAKQIEYMLEKYLNELNEDNN